MQGAAAQLAGGVQPVVEAVVAGAVGGQYRFAAGAGQQGDVLFDGVALLVKAAECGFVPRLAREQVGKAVVAGGLRLQCIEHGVAGRRRQHIGQVDAQVRGAAQHRVAEG
ncbi:hypothetical protein D9M71_542950 [compost metagenome]